MTEETKKLFLKLADSLDQRSRDTWYSYRDGVEKALDSVKEDIYSTIAEEIRNLVNEEA